MDVSANILSFKKNLPENVELIAVSKTKPISIIEQAYKTGHRAFGENKIQEMAQKWEALPKDIQWHMIGHVQTNKIKYMASFVYMVHGVDRKKLLVELQKQAQKHDRTIAILLQIKIAEEEHKFGFSMDEASSLLESNFINNNCPNLKLKGFMGMASLTNDTSQIQSEFKKLHSYYLNYKTPLNLDTLSMGMSGDYTIAIEEGSTLIRVGSALFGSRN